MLLMFDDFFGAKWCSYTFSVANASKHPVFLGLSQRIKLSLSLRWWFWGSQLFVIISYYFFAGIHFINCSKLHLPHPGRLPWRCLRKGQGLRSLRRWLQRLPIKQNNNRYILDNVLERILDFRNQYWPHWSHIKLHELKTSGFGRCLPVKFSVKIISLEIWQDIQTAKEVSIRNIMIKHYQYLWHTLIFNQIHILGHWNNHRTLQLRPNPSPGSTGLPQPLQRAQHLPPLPSG